MGITNRFTSEEYVEEKLAELEASFPSIQSDWNQEDEMSPEYIKNRPFYSTGEYEKTEVMKATQFQLMFDDVNCRTFMVGGGLTLVKDAEYMVTIEDQEYICKAQSDSDGYLLLGNVQFVDNEDFGWPDDVAPFVIFGFGYPTLMYTKPGFQIKSMIVDKIFEKIQYLDKKYVSNFLAGERVTNKEVSYDQQTYICGEGAEIFNSNSNIAIGVNSHAEGERTVAMGDTAHAEGYGSKALGDDSHAEGERTVASGACSHAEGSDTIADDLGAHAEGRNTQATNSGAHAEGLHTIANTPYLHVQGTYNLPEDIPKYSRVWMIWGSYPEYDGDKVIYIFNDEPAFNANEGTFSIVTMPYESSIKELKEGDYFVSVYPESDIIDIYYYASELKSTRVDESTGKTYYTWHYSGADYTKNSDPGTYLHMVGNGVYVYDESLKQHVEKRSNAHTLDWNGNAWYQGDVYVGSTSGIDKDEGSKKLATEDFVNEQVNNLIIVSDEEPEDGMLWIDKDTNEEIILAEIDDNDVSDEKTWSSSKIDEELNEFSNKVSLPTSGDTRDYGTAGQFAVSDGKGGIMWRTLHVVEEVEY